ncbi:MAG: GrpB family protein [Eubacteriales bacterium]|jgi:GrpB-like predicted nucleotidyltransferase (UPF0157 family)/8-oxo-dGTP pyrophosphatase MutT (NUDIX family)|nr:GrpB family protein [Eubacteriales bacterium]
MLELKQEQQCLLPHNPIWKEKAKETAAQLWEILKGCAIDIQHIGSTSVSSVKAKSIIDIAVGIKSFEQVLSLKHRLEEKGFMHQRENDSHRQLFFIKNSDKDAFACHIHMLIFESKKWRDFIGFRNYLNNDTEAAFVYEKIKSDLTKTYENKIDLYAQSKNPFILTAVRKAQAYYFLGKTVRVTVDRPIGSLHPKRGFAYPINYGYIEGVIAPDGEEMDVYILDEDKPCAAVDAKVTAIINRADDVEDKLVATTKDIIRNQAEIAELTHFQEKYYNTKVTSMSQKSCGVIVFRKNEQGIEFLLLFQKNSQTWSFPKGHIEAFETDEQAALRETKEETGLLVNLFDGFCERLFYPISDLIQKEVVLFLAKCTGKVTIDKTEIEKYAWVDKKTATRLLLHKEYENILAKACDFITSKGCF